MVKHEAAETTRHTPYRADRLFVDCAENFKRSPVTVMWKLHCCKTKQAQGNQLSRQEILVFWLQVVAVEMVRSDYICNIFSKYLQQNLLVE